MKKETIISFQFNKSATPDISLINSINVNGYMGIPSDRGSNSSNYYVSLLSRGQLLKESFCSCRSKILISKSRHHFKELSHP